MYVPKITYKIHLGTLKSGKMSTITNVLPPSSKFIRRHSEDAKFFTKTAGISSSTFCATQILTDLEDSMPKPTKFVKEASRLPSKCYSNMYRKKIDPEVLRAHRAAVTQMISDESASWIKTCELSDGWILDLQHADAAKNF